MKNKIPEIDMEVCSICEICIGLAPDVFWLNTVGYIEINDMEFYPQFDVNQAIKNCPPKAIAWADNFEG